MVTKVKITAKNGRYSSTYSCRDDLKGMGYRFDKKKKIWTKIVNSDQIHDEKLELRRLGLRCKIIYVENERGDHCREDFLETHRPDRRGKYRCAYCGRKFWPDQIAVDHIIPVHLASTSAFVCFLLHFFGLQNVNDVKNLCASCQTCNSKKGAKFGMWPIRGFLGKTRWFWSLVHFLLAALFIFIAYYLIFNIPHLNLT